MGAARATLALALVTTSLAACDFGSEDAFTQDRAYDTCDGAIPVCNTTAGCKLIEEDKYTDGRFPGQRQLIIPTAGEAVIRVILYWRSQLSPGADTEILWYEPACVETYRYESQGVDIFEESGGEAIFYKDKRVFREGDHLVEVRSDATAEYILKTVVLTPDEFDLEEEGAVGGEEGGPLLKLPGT